MTTVAASGSMTAIYTEDAEIFLDTETAANLYETGHFTAATIFEPANAFAFTTQTATLIEGYDPGSLDTMTLTGTNFLGTSGTITRAEFVGDDGGGIIIDGALGWTLNTGITGGRATKIDITAVDGSTVVEEGQFVLNATGDITGTVKKQTITTATGIVMELTGSYNVVTHQGTLTKIDVNDGAGNSLVLTSNFKAGSFFDTIGTSATLGDVFEFGLSGSDVITGSAAVDFLQGFDGKDFLKGLADNDMLDGGTGADSMAGGLGNDIFYADAEADRATELAGEGQDKVISAAANFTLGTNIEELELAAGNLNGKGNAGDNTLTGSDGNNTLDGAAGNDTLIGGKGDDVLVFDNVNDVAVEAAAEGNDTVRVAFDNAGPVVTLLVSDYANVENVAVTGKGLYDITGNSNDNILTGNAAANTLTGGKGDDLLDGGAGADYMDGGLDDDTFYVDNAGDVVVDANGDDTVIFRMTSGGYTLGADFENLVLFGSSATRGTGNASVNSLTGSTGANTLDGLGGADFMAGLAGNDVYLVDDSGDTVTEAAGAGTDTVRASDDFTLSADIENLVLTAGNIDGMGNAAVNSVTGSTGNNTIDGAGGVDKLAGGLGDDTYVIDLVASGATAKLQDSVTEGVNAGNDTIVLRAAALGLVNPVTLMLANNLENMDASLTGTNKINLTGNGVANILTGNDFGNTLKGAAGADTLDGGLGADILDGGAGIDALTGGGGADIFLFHAMDASSAANADVIAGFTAGVGGDVIDIGELLTGYAGGAIGAFVQLVEVGGDTIISVDRNGGTGGAAYVQVATLTGVTGLDADQMVTDGNLVVL